MCGRSTPCNPKVYFPAGRGPSVPGYWWVGLGVEGELSVLIDDCAHRRAETDDAVRGVVDAGSHTGEGVEAVRSEGAEDVKTEGVAGLCEHFVGSFPYQVGGDGPRSGQCLAFGKCRWRQCRLRGGRGAVGRVSATSAAMSGRLTLCTVALTAVCRLVTTGHLLLSTRDAARRRAGRRRYSSETVAHLAVRAASPSIPPLQQVTYAHAPQWGSARHGDALAGCAARWSAPRGHDRPGGIRMDRDDLPGPYRRQHHLVKRAHADSAVGERSGRHQWSARFAPDTVDDSAAARTVERLSALPVEHLRPGHGMPLHFASPWQPLRGHHDLHPRR